MLKRKDQESSITKTTPGLAWLCAAIFVLTAMPRLSMKIGPIPIYAVDVLLFITYYRAAQLKFLVPGKRPFTTYITVILVFAVIGEAVAAQISGVILEPIYVVIRTLLAVSLFYSVSKIVRTQADLLAVFKVCLLGLLITSTLMIMSSLPFTRSLTTTYVFSNPYLEPAWERTVTKYESSKESGVRGRSLVGVSILSGSFINILWPFVALLYRWPGQIGVWRNLALAGCLLAPFGVIMGYSRGPLIGLVFILVGVTIWGTSRSRQGVMLALAAATCVFMYVGVSSNLFFFDRFERRFTAAIENPFDDERETERINAYTEPFEHVLEKPTFLLFGEGTVINRVFHESEQRFKATHAVFAKAYYSYGMVAAFTYILLVASAFFYLLRQIRKRRKTSDLPSLFSQALFASLLGLVPWFLFGHAAVSQPRGAMMFFLLLGLAAALVNFPIAGAVRPERR